MMLCPMAIARPAVIVDAGHRTVIDEGIRFMYDPLGLSIGTTNLVAVRNGKPPVSRRAVLTLFPDRAPELGVPDEDSTSGCRGHRHADDRFRRTSRWIQTLKSADGSSHDPSLLLVEALDALITETGGEAATLEYHDGRSGPLGLRGVAGHAGCAEHPRRLRARRHRAATRAGFCCRADRAELRFPAARQGCCRTARFRRWRDQHHPGGCRVGLHRHRRHAALSKTSPATWSTRR